MRWLLPALALLLHAPLADARRAPAMVEVVEPYLEMRTGPGRGYPVFHVAERGEQVEVLKRRTDWYKLRTRRGKEGWARYDALALTVKPDGQPFEVPEASVSAYYARRWEMGAMTGDFGGANVVGAYLAYALSPNLAVELGVSQALGDFAESTISTLNVVHQFLPERRITPFFTLGGGAIATDPKATLVQTEDRNDQLAMAGFGLRAYLTRSFVFRTEYKHYVVFTSRDENQEVDEWKLGFTFFF